MDKNKIGHGQIVALVRFFYHKDPENMSLDEFCKLQSELMYLGSLGLLNIKIN